MWATLAAAGFFALILLVTLLRAEKSIANGALTVITLLAVGIAVAATIPGYGPLARTATDRHPAAVTAATAPLPAVSCVDDIAGDAVAAACEKAVFASADSTAAAVNRMAQMITAPDLVRRRDDGSEEHDPRVAGAAPRHRARSLWSGGASAAGPRPLYADAVPVVPLLDR